MSVSSWNAGRVQVGLEARWQQELEERHRKERELLVHHFAELHQHTMTLTMFRQLQLIG
jgi:hypothetical protein